MTNRICEVILGTLIILGASSANADCINTTRVTWSFAYEVPLTQAGDGTVCRIPLPLSSLPVYGAEIVTRPEHGTVTFENRTTVLYKPKANFKGKDTYVFEWIGVVRGKLPLSAKVRVTVVTK